MAEENNNSPKDPIKYTYFDFLALRPDFSHQFQAIPKPKGAIVKNGLPVWNVRPLNTKLPLLPGPEGPYVFSRGKLGTNLWRTIKQAEFTLNDPHGYEYSFDYEPIHDKHLKEWFKIPTNRDNLLKLGLVSEEMDVKCSIKQYNDYRKYLQRIYSNDLRKEAIRREDAFLEKMANKKAFENVQKEVKKLNIRADKSKKREENFEQIRATAEAKKRDCERRLRRIYERNTYVELMKKDNMKSSIERTRAKNEFIQNRIKAANKLERTRKIQTLRKWYDTDVERKKKNEKQLIQRQAENSRKAKERWEKKVEKQKCQIEKEEFIHVQRKLQLEISKNIRRKQIESEFASLQEKILLQQSQPTVNDVKNRFQKKQKNILTTVENMFFAEMSKSYATDPKTLETLRDKIKRTLKDIRCDLEPYVLINEAKKRLGSDLEIPLPVADTVNYLIEESIGISVAQKLEKIMYQITHRILQAIDKFNSNPTDKKSKMFVTKSSKSLLFNIENKVIVEPKISRVSFGAMLSVQKEEDIDLKSIKNRPPTPTPSVETIMVAALEDEDVEYQSTNFLAFTEQKKLTENIDSLGKWLLKNIDKRLPQIVESLRAKPSSRHPNIGVPNTLPHPLARLCNLTLFSTKDDFLNILDTIITDVLKAIQFQQPKK